MIMGDSDSNIVARPDAVTALASLWRDDQNSAGLRLSEHRQQRVVAGVIWGKDDPVDVPSKLIPPSNLFPMCVASYGTVMHRKALAGQKP